MPSREKCWFADHSFVVTGRVRLRSGTIHPSYPEHKSLKHKQAKPGTGRGRVQRCSCALHLVGEPRCSRPKTVPAANRSVSMMPPPFNSLSCTCSLPLMRRCHSIGESEQTEFARTRTSSIESRGHVMSEQDEAVRVCGTRCGRGLVPPAAAQGL